MLTNAYRALTQTRVKYSPTTFNAYGASRVISIHFNFILDSAAAIAFTDDVVGQPTTDYTGDYHNLRSLTKKE